MNRALTGTKAALAVAIFLAYCSVAVALNPSLEISQYAHKSWNVHEGSFRGPINAIEQTPDGYLWLGTEFGLYRFDGVRSVLWHPRGNQSLSSEVIRKLFVSRDGTLWIGTEEGLFSSKNGELTVYPDLPALRVDSVAEDSQGTIWIGLEDSPNWRLCSIENRVVHCFGENGTLGLGKGALLSDKKGNLWAGTGTGLWRWAPGSPESIRLSGPASEIHAIIQDRDGAVLIATRAGIIRVADRNTAAYRLPDSDPHLNPFSLLRDRDGGLWIGTKDRGLLHVSKGSTDHFGRANGLSSDYIAALFEDREGNIWVATANGLDRFHEFAVSTISVVHGYSVPSVESVLTDTDGSVWLGTRNGVDRWQNGRLTLYRKRRVRTPTTVRQIIDHGLPDDLQAAFYKDRRGRIWAFSPAGASYLNEREHFVRVPNLPGGFAHAIGEDAAGAIWVSQDQGLFRLLDGGKVEHVPWSKFGAQDLATALAGDPSRGGMWLGFSNGGLIYLNEGQVRERYSAAEGLANGRVNKLQIDKDGTFWVGTNGGLSRLRAGRIITLTSQNGLPCNSVQEFVRDNSPFIWLLTPCAVVRITRSQLEAWEADPKRRIETTVFDSSDGLTALANPGALSPRMGKSTDGRIWLVSGNGASVIDPRHLPINELAPPVHIEEIKADDETYTASNGLRLPPQLRSLEINFTALSLVAPEKVRFRVMLEGQDKDWRELVNERHVHYTNLAPRTYRFRVVACNNSGVWNEQGDTVEFSIAPAYYQTNWFRALCAAIGVAFFAFAYWWRIRAVEKRNRELALQVKDRTAELEERTAELQVAKDKAEDANHTKSAFLASVSHDLRTPLNGILGYVQILMKTDLTEKQQSGLDVIQQSGDHLLTLINDILELSRIEAGKLELNPADVHVPSFLSGIADMIRIRAEQKGLEFVLAAAHDLPEGVRADERRLRQVLLNLLDNAVKFTAHGKVVLQVDALEVNHSEARLRFEVADSGIGMSAEQLGRIFQPFVQVGDIHHRAAGMGLGLAICRRLVKLMGGDIQVRSKPGQGTAFWFELALPVIKAASKLPRVELAVDYSGPRKKVLVVDDVPANRAVLTDFLSTLGFEVAESANGQEGLKRACELRPDLILMDGVMPVMDGLEATRRLRQTPGFEGLPIIGISASASGSDAAAFLAAGANAFLTKPVAFPRLLAEMGTLMKIAWVYEPRAAETAKAKAVEELVLPPHEELAILHELAVFGNMYKIDERAEYLAALDERYRPLANRLHELAVGFKTKAVLALVEECMAREHIDEPASND